MLILSDGLGDRHPSEMRIAVCLILGPVFVLWFTGSSVEGTVSRDFGAGQSASARWFASGCGVVTTTTLEENESPEAFHA